MNRIETARRFTATTATVITVSRISGRNGFPAIWSRFEVHVDGGPLLRKDGIARTWGTAAAARAAAKREGLTV